MECAQCGASNREGARFCGDCGTALSRNCAACGNALDPSLKFCDQCGAPTGPPSPAPSASSSPTAPGAVRKTVTAMFADLGGSTSFGERTDPEIARVVMAQYHALLQATIDAHGGTVAKFMGDGMMALFGVPDVAEDDALRAVRAGADAQGRFQAFASEIARRYGETLTLRIGINTGEVVMAEGDADLVGDALNVAARLEKACRPGHVLVGEETWRLTRSEFGYESLGDVTVAGRAQPVAIYEMSEAIATINESVAAFVGRVDELQRLRAVFDRAASQRNAQLVTVLGSPGVGKTRLSREFTSRVAAEVGARSVEIRCDRSGEATFAPIAHLIREVAALDDEATPDIVRERIAALLPVNDDRSRLADVLAGVCGAATARSVEETFWAIRRLVESLATDHPIVIVIDDIQWAEPKLLDLLEHLGEWVAGAATTLVCLARPELRDVRAGLAEAGRRVADVIALDGLDRSDTEQLAASLLGAQHLPTGLVERLPMSTNGNPLFVRELVRMLVDDAVIERGHDGEWRLTIDAEAVEVPPTIQSLLASRVERLTGEERRVLELASVIGAELSLGALRALAGPSISVTTVLEALRRKEFLEPTGTYWGDEPMFRFHHVLIRDAAYRRLLKTARAELHQQVGEWMDAASEGLIGDNAASIAYHFEQAHNYRVDLGSLDGITDDLGARAAELLHTAARRALERDDLAASGALAARALRVLPARADATRAELLLLACECLFASGVVGDGPRWVEELRSLSSADEGLRSWAECFEAQLIGLSNPAGLVGAETTATNAAASFQRRGDGAGEAKAQQVRAGLLARLGRVGEAESVLDLALAAARAADDRRRVTAVLGAAPAAALFGPSPVARAGGRCLDVVRLLRITTASPSVEATSMRCQAVLEALRGRFDVSRSMLASARAALVELGLRHGLLETDLFAGMVEFVAGDFEAALAPLRSAYEGLGTLGVGADAGQAAAMLARALIERGDLDEADRMATASEQLAGQNLKTSIAWRIARAEVLAGRGAVVDAIEFARAAVEIAQRTDLLLDHADACAALAELLERAGDAAGSRSARDEALRLYEAKGAVVPAQRLAAKGVAPVLAAVVAAPAEHRVPPRSVPTRDSRTPTAENLATQSLSRLFALGDVADVDVVTMFSEGWSRIDRRAMVQFPVWTREDFATQWQQARGLGWTQWELSPMAVRGERHALVRVAVQTPAGDHNVYLNVVEVDANGTHMSWVYFDEHEIAAALGVLDDQYFAEEGAAWAELAGSSLVFIQAHRQRDFAAMRACLADDFVQIDRRSISLPTLDADGTVAAFQVAIDLAPDAVSIARVGYWSGRAMLFYDDLRGTTPDGNTYEWPSCIVSTVNDAGLLSCVEVFAAEDWDIALARLDELGQADLATSTAEFEARNLAATNPFTLTNLATQVDAKIVRVWATEHPDIEQFCAEWCTEDVVRVDHRKGVAGPDAHGREEYARALASTIELFDLLTTEVLEVGGERVALSRHTFTSSSSFQMVLLSLIETDAQGRVRQVDLFEDHDIVAARHAFLARNDELSSEQNRTPAAAGVSPALERLLPKYLRALESEWSQPVPDFVALCETWFDPAFVRADRRRGVSAPELHGPLEYARILSATRESFEQSVSQPIAFRGEQRWLFLNVLSNEAGFELRWLMVGETDNQGRVMSLTSFDDDDIDAATRFLDERYLASLDEHSAYTALRGFDYRDAFSAGNVEAVAALVHNDAVRIDHREMGYGTSDKRESRAIVQAWADSAVHRNSYIWMDVRGHAAIAQTLSVSTTTEGNTYEVELFSVAQYSAGLLTLVEFFGVDDHERARARYEELASEQRTPDADNTIVRAMVRGEWLAAYWNDATIRANPLAAVSPDVVERDHRSGVNAGEIVGREAWVGNQLQVAELFGTNTTTTPIAVLGDRLALMRVSLESQSGFRIEALGVFEADEQGRIASNDLFDEDDYVAAIEYLDSRHEEIRTEPPGEVERVMHLGRSAYNQRDFEALRALLAPDFVGVDHAPLGFGAGGDRDDYVRVLQTQVELAPDAIGTMVKSFARGEVALDVTHVRGTTVEGNAYEWRYFQVRVVSDGVMTRFESFGETQWSEALARFDELCAEGSGAARLSVERLFDTRVVRASSSLTVAINTSDWDFARRLLLEEFVRIDGRHGVSGDTTTTRGAWVAAATSSRESGLTIKHSDVIAVRGEQLALLSQVWDRDGFEVAMLVVAECDVDGLLVAYRYFDADDDDGAFAELDRRFIEGEGAPHAYVLQRRRDAARVEEGSDAFMALFSPTVRIVNHCRMAWPMSSIDDVVERSNANREITARTRSVPRWIAARNSVVISLCEDQFVTPEGSEYSSVFVRVSQIAAGLVETVEVYDPEDFDAACARFEELAAEPPTGVIDNFAVAQRARLQWLAQHGFLEEFVDMLAPDLEEHDHRRGVRGTIIGRDAWLTSQVEISAMIGTPRFATVAVRGARLALWRFEYVNPDAWEFCGYVINELDEDGRCRLIEVFDDDDHDGALQCIEDRYCAGEGKDHEYFIRRMGDGTRSYARHDWGAYAALFSPDLVATSHRTIGFPIAGRDDYLDTVRSLNTAVPNARLWQRSVEVRGDVGLVVTEVTGTTLDGSDYLWSALTVLHHTAGVIDALDVYDPEDRAAARARFEDLAAQPADPTVPDNAVVRLITRAQWLGEFDRGPERSRYLRAMWADDIEYRDLRKGVSGEAIVGRDAVNASILETRNVFGRIVEIPIAVHGEHGALFKLSWVTSDGFESTMWSLHEANESGAIARTTVFDESDFEAAQAALAATV